MENQKNPDLPQDENWLDDILAPHDLGDELGPDEHAVSSAGLKHPGDAKVDQIVDEVNSSGWADTTPELDDTQVVYSGEAFQDLPEENADPTSQTYDEPPYQEELPEDVESYGEEPEEDAPKRKRRPRRKKGYGLLGIPHLVATVVWLVIVVAIGVSLGRVAWVCAADLLAFGRDEAVVTFQVTDQDTIETISEKLKEAGLIRYPQLFRFYADLTDAQEEISTGTFQLNTLYDYHALVNAMSAYAEGREEVEVVIPEGYTCAQIFALLEEKGVCTAAELEEYAANGELNEYWFLEGVARGDKYCLEGYLFPDTYYFYTNDDPENALEKLLDGFDYRFTDKMKENITVMNENFSQMMRSNGYDEEYIAAHQLTIHDIVTIASMVEKETAGGSDSYKIASVIYNRLSNPEFTVLQIDAAIVYALGGKTDPLTYEDLQIDSPYNTYMYEGLPPTPISNPGRSSIYAALEPFTDDTYYYYAYDPDTGEHHYSHTYAEHEAFLETVDYE